MSDHKIPVAQRLPESPLMVDPVDSIGTYGGTWHMAIRRDMDHALLIRTIGYENLMRWTPDGKETIPNIAQTVEVNDKATEYIFTLRKGMRWSDGRFFTADDIIFWYKDVVSNSDLSQGSDVWRVSGGKRFQVVKLDDHRIKFVFATPHSLFLQNLAAPEGAEPTSYPGHYLKPFHISYNPEANTEAKAQGYEDWGALFRAKFGNPGSIDDKSRWVNSKMPTLHAWILEGTYGVDDPLIATRNPYYWKIDTVGQQLPYIDKVHFAVVKNKSEARALARKGKVDMQMRHMSHFADDIFKNQQQGEGKGRFAGLKSFRAYDTDMNLAVLNLNLNHKDTETRTLFQNKAFRIALSYGYDRQKIIDTILKGEGQPYQAAPRPQSPYYHEELATQFLEFNPEKASGILDALGFRKRDSDGYRLNRDGNRLTYFVDTVGDTRLAIIQSITDDWRKLGLDFIPRNLARDEFYALHAANEQDISVWGGDGGMNVLLSPIFYFPYTYESFFATRWAFWLQNPGDPRAEEPPVPAKEQMRLFRQLTRSASKNRQNRLMQKILSIAQENFWVIGTVLPRIDNGIVKQNFKNVPEFMLSGWTYPHPAPTNPAQYYISP